MPALLPLEEEIHILKTSYFVTLLYYSQTFITNKIEQKQSKMSLVFYFLVGTLIVV